jgi:hypothetical protein
MEPCIDTKGDTTSMRMRIVTLHKEEWRMFREVENIYPDAVSVWNRVIHTAIHTGQLLFGSV